MQIRWAQPNAIQRQVCVAKSFSEMTEPARIPGIEIVLCHGQFFGVGIEPMTVSADFIDRHDVTNVFAAEITAIASMTICAVLGVKFFTLCAQLRIDRKRVFGQLLGYQPLLDTRELLQIDRRRKRTGAE